MPSPGCNEAGSKPFLWAKRSGAAVGFLCDAFIEKKKITLPHVERRGGDGVFDDDLVQPGLLQLASGQFFAAAFAAGLNNEKAAIFNGSCARKPG